MRQSEEKSSTTFLLSLVHLAIPLGLVVMQPHLGAALVLMVIWLAMSLAAEVPLKYIGYSVALTLLLAVGVVKVPAIRGLIWGTTRPSA